VEWWNEFKHRTVERDVLVVFNQTVWDLVKCRVVARDVLVGFFGAVRAVVVVNEVEVQREVSESRSNKWRIPGVGVGVQSERWESWIDIFNSPNGENSKR
jgi:hypothetical protein